MTTRLVYDCLLPKQSNKTIVCSFCANPKDILKFAEVDHIGRDEDGNLRGFQRPQIANHIREIRNYVSQPDAVLPNSVVVAFIQGANVDQTCGSGLGKLTIELGTVRGYVVDGQQRLTALSDLDKDFEVNVSALLCDSDEELRKQFILINNSRPLPKQLIYELLPGVDALPDRLSARTTAARLVERLNYDENSSLHGYIRQHTNPTGVISDTVIQRLIMNSQTDGAMRELSHDPEGGERFYRLVNNFFAAVKEVFGEAWYGKKPRTSRLVHGAGIISMGYVMEYLFSRYHAFEKEDFEPYLRELAPHTAWTTGHWEFDDGTRRPWNDIQNVPRDYMQLSQHLLSRLRHQCQVPHVVNR